MAIMLRYASADEFFAELPDGAVIYLADIGEDGASPPVVRATPVAILPGDTQRMWASDDKLPLDDPRVAGRPRLTGYSVL